MSTFCAPQREPFPGGGVRLQTGKTLAVCTDEMLAATGDQQNTVAVTQATMMAVQRT